MVKHVGKRGDTLIEVMLAVGIFSMVAVAVVAVMSGGTSSAQTALETTLAREEIDAQAEALRFIQSSYIADKNSGEEGKYSKLWKQITAQAANYDYESNKFDDLTNEAKDALAQYSPSSCASLYEINSEAIQHGFVLNTHTVGTFSEPSEVIASGSETLTQASTYPRLVFEGSENTLLDNSFGRLKQAEGIYIIAIKDPTSTNVAGSDNGKEAAYFDFYIRTCWYGTGDQNPSTISTVMRLYDPDAIKEIKVTPNTDPGQVLADKKYKIDGAEPFATIMDRTYAKNSTGAAILGFSCRTLPKEGNADGIGYFVGPILVSSDPDAVRFNTGADSQTSIKEYNPAEHYFVYDDYKYYYSSWEAWMEITHRGLTCSDNDIGQIKEEVIQWSLLGDNYPLFITPEPKASGPDNVKEDAIKLITEASNS